MIIKNLSILPFLREMIVDYPKQEENRFITKFLGTDLLVKKGSINDASVTFEQEDRGVSSSLPSIVVYKYKRIAYDDFADQLKFKSSSVYNKKEDALNLDII